MTVQEHLASFLTAAAEPMLDGPDGAKVFPRDDDVIFSSWVAEKLNQPGRPAVFTDGAFHLYDDGTGAWVKVAPAEVKRMVMGLSGMKLYDGKVKKIVKEEKEREDGGVEVVTHVEEEIATKPINLKNARIDGIVACTEARMEHEGFFDDAPAGLAFKNGFVTVDEGGVKIGDKRPENRARAAAGWAYRDHPCPKWTQFMRDVFEGDDDAEPKRMCIQEFFGLALLGMATAYEKALVLYGSGGNGKSVLLDVVQKCFPEEAVASVPPQALDDQYYRARLAGVKLNVVSELPQRELVDSPAFKGVISGDRISARHPTERAFEYRPKAGHVFAANPPLPSVGDLSKGFWRRFVFITFNRNFDTEMHLKRHDKDVFVRELQDEIKGITRWALEGAARVRRQSGLTVVPSSEAMLDAWRLSVDNVAMFLKECTQREPEPVEMATTTDLYRAYRRWAEATGHRMPLSQPRFLDRLVQHGLPPIQDGAQSVRAVRLINLPRPVFRTGPDDAQDLFS